LCRGKTTEVREGRVKQSKVESEEEEIITKDLTDQIEISKILEKQLKTENKAHKKDNAKMIKTNEKLQEEIRKLKRRNELLSKQAFKCLKDKNMWQAKYEKQKVKEAMLKVKQETEFDCLNRETTTGTTSTLEGRRSKRSKQA